MGKSFFKGTNLIAMLQDSQKKGRQHPIPPESIKAFCQSSCGVKNNKRRYL